MQPAGTMSVCQTEEDSASEEMGNQRDASDQKAVSTVVRVLTVLAYLLSVSLAAILLSVYYVCVWKSPELPPINDTGEVAARRAAPPHFDYYPDAFRGSNSTVSENATQLGNMTDDGFWVGNDTSEPSELGIGYADLGSTPAADAAAGPVAHGALNTTGNVT